ncbi:hypothetical protein [Taibaiella chishuiensis]|uniref:APCDD1 domain-containing protein n=1 Tax=Taibaiella chishuiensis TaxID=1434707 RepID=A0A2P8D7P0_9BACT|nr:hypothetical protein [Taibaiella chishuiensis]PSK93209.1 hypothetical protein B0I18_102179 [Taibaiella chishuiensis]
MSIDQIKKEAAGAWQSLATEVRPGNQKNEAGSPKPFYLKRRFKLNTDDVFELEVINYADAEGRVTLAKMEIKGHIEWQGAHPLVGGAQKADFTADLDYLVTPLAEAFTGLLNTVATGFDTWETGKSQSVFRKNFPPFGLKEGQIFKEYDLVYLQDNYMFWGARHVDGRGFDTEANRPAHLQIPMKRAL